MARNLTAERGDLHVHEGIEPTNADRPGDDGARASATTCSVARDQRADTCTPADDVAPCRWHALDTLRPAPRRARAVREGPHARRDHGGQFPNEPRQDPHRIPQQRVIGGMIDVGSGRTVVSTRSFVPSSRPRVTAARMTAALTACSVRGVRRLTARLNASCRGAPLAVEGGEVPQRVAVRNPFAQFPIIPVLHAHQDHRPEYLRSRQPCPSGRGLFQASSQIAPHAFNDGAMLVEEIRDALRGGARGRCPV